MLHHLEYIFIKYHEQKFSIKFAFSGKHWTRLCIEQCKKIQFLGCLIKISNSGLNFSTESARERTVYDLLFLIVIYSPKNDNKHPSKMRNYHHSSHFTITNKVFSGLVPIFTTALKYWLTVKLLQIFFYLKIFLCK